MTDELGGEIVAFIFKRLVGVGAKSKFIGFVMIFDGYYNTRAVLY